MSLGEIAVIFFIAFLVLSPKDMKKLLQSFYRARKYFTQIEKKIHTIIHQELKEIEESKDHLLAEFHDINYYMKKIIDLGSVYQGNYDLEDVKNYYEKLATKKSEYLRK
jgi:Sec-independent protein translocase protein TatA